MDLCPHGHPTSIKRTNKAVCGFVSTRTPYLHPQDQQGSVWICVRTDTLPPSTGPAGQSVDLCLHGHPTSIKRTNKAVCGFVSTRTPYLHPQDQQGSVWICVHTDTLPPSTGPAGQCVDLCPHGHPTSIHRTSRAVCGFVSARTPYLHPQDQQGSLWICVHTDTLPPSKGPIRQSVDLCPHGHPTSIHRTSRAVCGFVSTRTPYLHPQDQQGSVWICVRTDTLPPSTGPAGQCVDLCPHGHPTSIKRTNKAVCGFVSARTPYLHQQDQ